MAFATPSSHGLIENGRGGLCARIDNCDSTPGLVDGENVINDGDLLQIGIKNSMNQEEH